MQYEFVLSKGARVLANGKGEKALQEVLLELDAVIAGEQK